MRMRKSASWTCVVPAFVLAGALSAGIAAPTLASCMELPLPERTDRRAVVFIGTVVDVDVDEGSTLLDVEAWYLGDDPTESAVVAGGLMYPGGERETSGDWTPEQGERYAMVAERSANGTLETDVCVQQLVNGRTLSRLSEAYGDPSIPPFVLDPTPEPASIRPTEAPAQTAAPPAPDALPPADLIEPPAGVPESGASPGVVLVALVLAAAATLLTILAARRQPRRS